VNRAAGPTSAKDKGAGAPGTPVTPAGFQHGKLGAEPHKKYGNFGILNLRVLRYCVKWDIKY